MDQTKVIIISALFATIFVFAPCEGQLTSMSVKEVDCPADMATLDLQRARDYPLTLPFFIRSAVCSYLPMASKLTYRRWAEAFLGRPATDQAEIDDMGYRTFLAYDYGYNKPQFARIAAPYVSPNGSVSDKYIINFPAIPGTARNGTNVSALQLITTGVVWTDDLTSVLVVDCMNGDALDWAVYTTTPTIPEAVKDLVLEKIVAFGFDPANAEYMTYQPGAVLPALCPLPLLPLGLGK